MAPVDRPQHERYDYICIGGGSGGVASSASHLKGSPFSSLILPPASRGPVWQESCPHRGFPPPGRYVRERW